MSFPVYDTHPEAWHGIDPAHTELAVKGLKRPYTFFHITDLHMGCFTSEEAAEMPENRRTYAQHRLEFFSREGRGASELWEEYMACAAREGAELLLLTGDMIDFPSNANLARLMKGVYDSPIPSLYVVGNHDWSFADDYHTPHAEEAHLPKFAELSGGDPHLTWREYRDLIVCAVDDSMDRVSRETVDGFLSLCEKGKPVIVILHIPLYVESMVPDCRASWGGRVLMMGGEGLYGDDPHVKRFYEAVALDPHTPVVAVIAGHLHFHHEDVLPNGVPQIVTDKGYTGGCRTIHITPEKG